MLNLQIAILNKNSTQQNYILKIKKLASDLEDKSAIPGVKAQMELILELQTDTWWEYVTLPMLEQVRIKLRELIKFVDKEEEYTDVFTNFEDKQGETSEEYQLVKSDANLTEYRKRVRRL